MLQEFVKKISDNTNQQSLSHQYRRKRFEQFKALLNQLPRPVTILDIGGTEAFWKGMGFNEPDVTITLLNLAEAPPAQLPFITLKGDTTRLEGIADQQYDIVFSNSVIEHLCTWGDQQKMAAEVQRVGRYHYI
ncbi:MAG: class I SAM-dependent methyltransferase, partial [Sediminibacterium sp.]